MAYCMGSRLDFHDAQVQHRLRQWALRLGTPLFEAFADHPDAITGLLSALEKYKNRVESGDYVTPMYGVDYTFPGFDPSDGQWNFVSLFNILMSSRRFRVKSFLFSLPSYLGLWKRNLRTWLIYIACQFCDNFLAYYFDQYSPIIYYWTVPLILDHSYIVEKLTSSKIADTKVSGFWRF
jgi:hypothetical protein